VLIVYPIYDDLHRLSVLSLNVHDGNKKDGPYGIKSFKNITNISW
jgi:hypothetical protein